MQMNLLCSIKKKSLQMQYQDNAKVKKDKLYRSIFNM